MEPDSTEARIVLRTMVLMMMADGHLDPNEVGTIVDIFGQMTGHTISGEQMKSEIEHASNDGLEVLAYLEKMADDLPTHGKGTILEAVTYVAGADAEIAENERKMIVSIGRAMKLSDAEIKKVVNESLDKMVN